MIPHLTGRSRVVGVMGDPIAHSLSPVMQNAALQATAIDAVYVPLHVTAADLEAAIDAIRRLDLVGVNLTIPHKETALPFVDLVEESARLGGSINTIVNRNGRLTGYNTDGPGLLRALQQEFGWEARGQRVLLLGAGGACRAAVVALGRAGADWIGIANRTGERAAQLTASFEPLLPETTFAPFRLDAGLPQRLPGKVDLLINTTSVGLQQDSFDLPVEEAVRAGGAVYDMVYGRQPTALVQAARRLGLQATDGLGMLAAQGELAFRLWFEQAPPAGLMKRMLMTVRSDG